MIKKASKITCDIFCRVVDNFGDIGVTWRLARQLSNEFDVDCRLIVDDLASFQKLAPEIDMTAPTQLVGGITVVRWDKNLNLQPAQCVIEAFGCDTPTQYVASMVATAQKPVWLNLEYLSAESWVGAHHLLPSPDPQTGMLKYFFFPGLRDGTGGLIREKNLFAERDLFLDKFLRNKPAESAEPIEPAKPASAATKIFLFGYQNAAIPGLLESFQVSNVSCTIPKGALLTQLQIQIKTHTTVQAATQKTQPVRALATDFSITEIQFSPQPQFDHLLWEHDILFVRGEDSFVRAQWAAKPFIWQIYPQADRAHWVKLNAFLDLYCDGLDAALAAVVRELHHAWNDQDNTRIGAAFQAFMAQTPRLSLHAKNWAKKLAQTPDLATQLMTFYAKTAKI